VGAGLIIRKQPPDLVTGTTTPIEVITPDYYVDSSASAGGDGSLATPYDEISDLSLSADDIVALKSGSTFAETLTLVSGVSVYRYGSGNRPILDAGVTFTPASWAATTGRTNVYEQDVAIELASTKSFVSVLEDGAHMSRVADVATCDSTAGSYTVSTDSGSGDSTVTVYIHPTGSTNPTSNGSTYRYSRKLYSVNGTDIDDVIVDGIHTRLQSSENGSLRVGGAGTLRFCKAEFGSKHNIFIKDGCDTRGTVADEAYYNSSFSLWIYNEDTPTSEGITIKSCAAVMSAIDSNATGLNGHVNTSGDFGEVMIERFYTTNMTTAVSDTSDSTAVTLKQCYSLNDSKFAQLEFDGAKVIDCGIKTNVSSSRPITQNAGVTLIIKGGYIWCSDAVNGGMVYSTQSGDVLIEDVLFYNTSSSNVRRAVYGNDASLVMKIYNCAFRFDTVQDYFNLVSIATFTADGNQYHADDSFIIDGTTYNTLALYVAGEDQDNGAVIGRVDISRLGE